MLITEGNLYIDRHTVGKFHIYLAVETATDEVQAVKVIDLTRDYPMYLSSDVVYLFEDTLESLHDDELLEVAKKYNY